MNLADFNIGKWYKRMGLEDFYFNVVGINTNIYYKGSGYHLDVLQMSDRSFEKLRGFSYISNPDYWYDAVEISFEKLPEKYHSSLPKEYLLEKEFQPLIFN